MLKEGYLTDWAARAEIDSDTVLTLKDQYTFGELCTKAIYEVYEKYLGEEHKDTIYPKICICQKDFDGIKDRLKPLEQISAEEMIMIDKRRFPAACYPFESKQLRGTSRRIEVMGYIPRNEIYITSMDSKFFRHEQ
ncbi:MAG TPA: hypothetical protein VJB08_05735 [Candidatus Nanoarchaeia archaeon]|nr:hypothetical protein [Candidatus Nanoarchaeia archaeon]